VDVTNNGSRDVFLLDVAFDWVGTSQTFVAPASAAIGTGQTHTVKALAIDGPLVPGTYEYMLRMRCLQLRNGNWYRVMSGGDEWLSFSEHTVEVLGLPEPRETETAANTRMYYERVNQLADAGSEAVLAAAAEATAGMGAGFDIGRACAIFDYLAAVINYTEDPGGDKWYSPERTLEKRTGDCEDYAILLASMVKSQGGSARVYLTADHAFAAVYIGNSSSDLDNATADVRGHYRTPVQVHALADRTGFWVVADPLGSFYLGGPAVGQSPTSQEGNVWNTTFEETDVLHALDVTGDPETVPMWLDTMFWMGMMLLTGFCALGFTVAAMSDKPAYASQYCHICAREIADDPYVCPTCRTTYHTPCAYSKAYCMTCGKPTMYPPPPPPRQ
jgi:hypothetical protein